MAFSERVYLENVTSGRAETRPHNAQHFAYTHILEQLNDTYTLHHTSSQPASRVCGQCVGSVSTAIVWLVEIHGVQQYVYMQVGITYS